MRRSHCGLFVCVLSSIGALAWVARGAGPVLATFEEREPTNNTAGGSDSVQLASRGFAQTAIYHLTPGDADFFIVSIGAGESFLVTTTPLESLPGSFVGPDTVVTVYDAALSFVAESDDAGADFPNFSERGSLVRVKSAGGGSYFVRVIGYDASESGRYAITFAKTYSGSDWFENEGNNSPALADELGVAYAGPLSGSAELGPIGGPPDTDYYAIDLRAGDALSVATVGGFNFVVADTILAVLDRDGTTVLRENDDDGGGIYPPGDNYGSLLRFRCPHTGRYFLRVTGYFGSTGDYRMTTSLIPAAPCDGDADGDGVVSFPDITAVLRNWALVCP